MKFFKYILGIVLSFSSFFLFSQERVTTIGIQLKPILPIDIANSGDQETESDDVQFGLNPKSGLGFGMVIRKGFTKNLSLETGINLLRRNFDFTINDPDSSFSSKNNFRLINYEIPVLGLVYVQLGEQTFMNVAGGISLDFYPTDLFIPDGIHSNSVNRKGKYGWIRASLIANVGWEYRTRESGYFYFGASFHRSFSSVATSFVAYDRTDKIVEGIFDLSGNYLTLDFRYFFHEDKEKKKKKIKKKKKVNKDFRVPRSKVFPNGE